GIRGIAQNRESVYCAAVAVPLQDRSNPGRPSVAILVDAFAVKINRRMGARPCEPSSDLLLPNNWIPLN
ncbi:MAG TPA: hypothetical protein VMU47_14245, partial [Caldimonas sp.]|nr:hypothetical protein [Caldimonas sp.]